MSFAHRLLIRTVMRHRGGPFIALLLCAISVAHAAAPTTLTVNTLSDVYGGDCSGTCSLRDAMTNIASGGTIDFATALLPGTIVLGSPLHPTVSMRIQDPGAAQLVISANYLGRVLVMDSSADIVVNIVGVTLRDGFLYGTNGGNGAAGTGANAESGGSAEGGCILVTAGSLVLDQVDIRNCLTQGGTGGDGGTGTAGSGLSAGGTGGHGGDGGFGTGAGIAVEDEFGNSNLTLRNSSLTNIEAFGGDAGAGGAGGSGVFNGTGGNGGHGGPALGGGIYFYGGSLSIYNTTISNGSAIGTAGGVGGIGDSSAASDHGGNGGDGGSAAGGLLYSIHATVTRLEFATLVYGSLDSGLGGQGGAGKVAGATGQRGTAQGSALDTFSNLSALSTIIVGIAYDFGAGPEPLCSGVPISVYSANLDEDSSCGFPLHATFAQLFRVVQLLDPSIHLPAYIPIYHSAAIDAATTCNDLTLDAVTADEHGTPRPQGAKCDLGAIEADYIFVDGFE